MSENEPFCVALFDRGPAWVDGRTSREQPYWDEHAAFVDGLADGRIVLAGPFADWTGALLIVRGDVGAGGGALRDGPVRRPRRVRGARRAAVGDLGRRARSAVIVAGTRGRSRTNAPLRLGELAG